MRFTIHILGFSQDAKISRAIYTGKEAEACSEQTAWGLLDEKQERKIGDP